MAQSRNTHDALRITIQSTIGVDAPKQENCVHIFKRLKVQGLGDLYQRDKFYS